MTWPELIGWTLQCVLWANLFSRYASPRLIAYMTAQELPEDDLPEGEEMDTMMTRAHQLRSLGRLAQDLGFEVTYSARRETEGHNAGHILTGITIATTTKEN